MNLIVINGNREKGNDVSKHLFIIPILFLVLSAPDTNSSLGDRKLTHVPCSRRTHSSHIVGSHRHLNKGLFKCSEVILALGILLIL